jgi:hypothetical protein
MKHVVQLGHGPRNCTIENVHAYSAVLESITYEQPMTIHLATATVRLPHNRYRKYLVKSIVPTGQAPTFWIRNGRQQG